MMKNVKEAVEILKKGGVIIAPTDTVYGLICDATNKKAVEKIFKIKKRSKSKPLPIFVKDIKMAKNLTELSFEQEKFLKKVWPGKTTVVLKRKKSKIKLYGVAKDTIALRVPKHKVISYLLSAIGRPLAQTSANISGQPASSNIKEVLRQFGSQKIKLDLIIDDGNLPKSKPSKIIDLTVWPPKILRP